MKFSRRQVTAGLALASVAAPLLGQQRRPKLVRNDVATPAGAHDLEKYARAVAIMVSLPAEDPRSWTYQWYIHSIPSDRTKQSEIARLYPIASPARALAAECWSTCEAHFQGADPDLFLPWHRAYLICFEATVRAVLNDPSFALPYWNYTQAGERALPAAFLPRPGMADGPLVRPNRTAAVNAGGAIDAAVAAPSPISAAALTQTGYRPRGPQLGFCQQLDRTLHGSVHTLVGNGRGMGSVPWAANDPIFWLHHANIDRLWASWNALGGTNPTDPAFLARTFAFPDGTSGRAAISVRQVSSLAVAGYSYDRLEPGQQIVTATAGQVERQSVIVGQSDRPLTIAPEGADVPIRRSGRPPKVAGVAGRRTFLVLSGLQAPAQPGVLYEVRVRDRKKTWRTAGFINFFDAVPMAHDMPGMAPALTPREGSFSFDVTEFVEGSGKVPEVRVVPAGSPEGGVVVSVASVTVVEF